MPPQNISFISTSAEHSNNPVALGLKWGVSIIQVRERHVIFRSVNECVVMKCNSLVIVVA